MITKLTVFLAEKKKQQENLSKVNENDNTGEAPAVDNAQPDAAAQAAELKALVGNVAAELGLNPAKVEAEVEADIKDTTSTNESFIDTITSAINTFGQEAGNLNSASFSTGIIIFLMLGAATAALWAGVSLTDKAKAKKALRAYLYFKYKGKIEKISKDQLKGFIVDKVKELQANKALMDDIATKSDLYLSKYGKYVTESVLDTNKDVVNELFGFGKKTYILDDTFKATPDAEEFTNKRKDMVAQYNKLFIKQGMDADTAAKASKALKMFVGGDANGAIPLLKSYNITYDVVTKTLVIDPNGKGFFNGSPIMG